jgi:hypothetical protein
LLNILMIITRRKQRRSKLHIEISQCFPNGVNEQMMTMIWQTKHTNNN